MLTFSEQINELFVTNVPFVIVTVVDTLGSVPQDPGNKVAVTAEGLYCGTVGGGKVEARALAEAREMLANKLLSNTKFVNWSLNRDIGMTCGGSVKMFMEVFNRPLWEIIVFGAGHCANALIGLLSKLDCSITCYDTREQWLEKLPQSNKLTKICASNLPEQVINLQHETFVVLMTMGHSTDMPILLEVLRNIEEKHFSYVGVIGSAAKAARLRSDVIASGLPHEATKKFYCPMGLPFGSNHPQEIAISIAAHLIEVRDRLRNMPEVLEDMPAQRIIQLAQGAEL